MRRDPTSPVGTFAMTVEEIRNLSTRILALAEDHMGIDMSVVTWAHVAAADTGLDQLKAVARTMGLEVDR